MGQKSSGAWIDFRALRQSIDIRRVLKHYNVLVKDKGRQAMAFCPLPSHKGKRRSMSFSVNFEKGIWQCFGCSAKGNVIDLCARMEGLDPFNGGNIRKAAIMLRDLFASGAEVPARAPEPKRNPMPDVCNGHGPSASVMVNAPLDFELRNLDIEHPCLAKRGFLPQKVKHFGLGFCNRGMFKGRIVIPIRNATGQLVGYAGRLVDDRAASDTNPKYKLPAPREREGKRHEFHKSKLLYNLDRVGKHLPEIVVVEGFPSVWWLWQHGWNNAVATMGSACSDVQAKLIASKVDFDGRVWVIADGDAAGEHFGQSAAGAIGKNRFVQWIRLADSEQPTDCTAEDLRAMLYG